MNIKHIEFLKKEILIIISLSLLVLVMTSIGTLRQKPERLSAKDTIDIYLTYIFLWEYGKAYNFLSDAAKETYNNNVVCFDPETPWGKDWYNLMTGDNFKLVCLQAKVHQSHLSVLYFKPS